MTKLLIKNAKIVNENQIFDGSILIEDDKIVDIYTNPILEHAGYQIFDVQGNYVLPGIIDIHVHFREPGLTHKGDIFSESRAAAVGGVTSFVDMPNTLPPTIDKNSLSQKFAIAQEKSLINYSFYLAATNDNLKELKKLDTASFAGIKLFYGSSTGNIVVDKSQVISKLLKFKNIPIVVHSEKDRIIKQNIEHLKKANIPLQAYHHPRIRSAQACVEATQELLKMAIDNKTKMHFLHISTKEEIDLIQKLTFDRKLITFETCPHYLIFDANDYQSLGNKIKCNPAIKTPEDKLTILKALTDGIIDTIGTDHAPHTIDEKLNDYEKAPSGIPSIQHSLNIMLEFVHQKKFNLDILVEKMCHNPARILGISKRGFIRKGYFADLVVVDMHQKTIVSKDTIKYKCQWSPLESKTFNSKILYTIVNGKIVYDGNSIIEQKAAQKLEFIR